MLVFIIIVSITIFDSFKQAEKIICKPGYRMWHFFGLPGCGKTTIAADLVRNAIKNKRTIYSNVAIRGAKKYSLKDLGKFDLRDCDLIIDEAGVELGNRSWHSNLSQEQIDILKKYRHYHLNVYLFSQTVNDYDNKFRDLINCTFFVNKSKIPFHVVANAIKKKLDLIDGQFITYYEYDKSNDFRIFAPKDWAYFNSFETRKDLKPMYEKIYTIIDTN